MSNITPDHELQAFASEWAERSCCLNWDPEYNGEIITLQNFEKLESRYLDDIDQAKDKYIFDRVQARSMNRETAGKMFMRNLCKEDSYYLGKYVLGYDLSTFYLHYPLCRAIERRIEEPGGRTLIQLPRDMYKTTFATKTQSVRMTLNNPNVRILIKSAAENNAAAMLEEAKKSFWECDTLAYLFPEHLPNTKQDQGSGIKWTTLARNINRSEGTFNASGVGSTKVSAHYDFIFGDDFWDEAAVNTPTVLAKCLKELDNIKYLLQAPARGSIILVGTRWAHDDPTVDILERPNWYSIIVSAITAEGSSLFPHQLPMQELYNMCDENMYNFSCQMMLSPKSQSQHFEREWFSYLDANELIEQEDQGKITYRCVILTDFTGDDAAKSDPFAALAVLVDNIGRKIVVDYAHERLTPYDAIHTTLALADKWNADMIVYQKAPLENAMMSFVLKIQKERRNEGGRAYHWYPYSLGKKSKIQRMRALQPMFQANEIFFQKWMNDLERQILDFPFARSNDDLMDALSELTDENVCKRPSKKPKNPEDQEPEYTGPKLPDVPDEHKDKLKKIFDEAIASGMCESEAVYRVQQIAQRIAYRQKQDKLTAMRRKKSNKAVA